MKQRLEKWLNQNRHGEMSYMENYFDKRLDPRLLVDGAKTVISLLLNYYTDASQIDGAQRFQNMLMEKIIIT